MTLANQVKDDALQTAKEWMKKYPVVDNLAAGMGSEQSYLACLEGGVDIISGGGGGPTPKAAFMGVLNMKWTVQRMPDKLTLVTTVAEMEKARAEGKLAMFINWQHAEALEDDYHWLEVFYDNGLRMLNFAYNGESKLSYGCLEPHDMGLKRYGIDILQDCNRLGILLDVTHQGERSSLDVIEMSKEPVVFSHSGAKAVWENGRNISDTQIKECAAKGGVIGIPTFSAFVGDTTNNRQPTLDEWMKHVDHDVNLVGIDHVGIGTDLYASTGGVIWWENNTGRRYRDISGGMHFDNHDILNGKHTDFPYLVAALVQRGYKEEDVSKIIGGNWLRVFRQVWGA